MVDPRHDVAACQSLRAQGSSWSCSPSTPAPHPPDNCSSDQAAFGTFSKSETLANDNTCQVSVGLQRSSIGTEHHNIRQPDSESYQSGYPSFDPAPVGGHSTAVPSSHSQHPPLPLTTASPAYLVTSPAGLTLQATLSSSPPPSALKAARRSFMGVSYLPSNPHAGTESECANLAPALEFHIPPAASADCAHSAWRLSHVDVDLVESASHIPTPINQVCNLGSEPCTLHINIYATHTRIYVVRFQTLHKAAP